MSEKKEFPKFTPEQRAEQKKASAARSAMLVTEFFAGDEDLNAKKEKERHLEGLGRAEKRLYLRAATKRASAIQIIKAKCQECCGYEEYRERIASCASWRCPLWASRPYQKSELIKTSP